MEKNETRVLIISLMTLICFLITIYTYNDAGNETKFIQKVVNPAKKYYWKDKDIVSLAKALHQATVHVRGLKTKSHLTTAVNIVKKILKEKNLKYDDVIRRDFGVSGNVCPEKYVDTKLGYPFYHIGYIDLNCTLEVGISNIVTMILKTDFRDRRMLTMLIKKIRVEYPDIVIYILIKSRSKLEIENFRNVFIEYYVNARNLGQLYNSVLNRVKTTYVYLARDLIEFTNDTRLHRLVREKEITGAKVVGGSFHNSNNHWHLGCYQQAWLNFTLVYYEGYDESIHDCMFCDYVEGSFLMETNFAKALKFDERLPYFGLFEDFFLRLTGDVLICPDSMTYVHKLPFSQSDDKYKLFAEKRKLYQMKISSNIINFGCAYNYPCQKKSGLLIHPCCTQELLNLTNMVMDWCDKGAILCEIHGGTLVGAVKFHNVLPWERDSDIRIIHSNFSSVRTLLDSLRAKGVRISKGPDPAPCLPNSNRDPGKRGYYTFSSKNWHVDFWTFCTSDVLRNKQLGINQTLIYHGDKFVLGPSNPPLSARNRYPGLYKHAEHYSVLGLGSFSVYTSGFKSCKSLNRDCLNLYNSDGNMAMEIGPLP